MNGSVTITYPVTAVTKFFINRRVDMGGVANSYSIASTILGTSFTVKANNGTGNILITDNSTLSWLAIE